MRWEYASEICFGNLLGSLGRVVVFWWCYYNNNRGITKNGLKHHIPLLFGILLSIHFNIGLGSHPRASGVRSVLRRGRGSLLITLEQLRLRFGERAREVARVPRSPSPELRRLEREIENLRSTKQTHSSKFKDLEDQVQRFRGFANVQVTCSVQSIQRWFTNLYYMYVCPERSSILGAGRTRLLMPTEEGVTRHCRLSEYFRHFVQTDRGQR